MAQFDIPATADIKHLQLTNFLGVDYNDYIEDNRRSPKMINFINKNGYLETRNGHKILIQLDDAPINGIWNIDANKDIFVVHCGTKLFEVSSDFTQSVVIKTDLANIKSTGIYLGGKLLILDGKRALIYGKFGNDWMVEYADEIGYIPRTVISLNPDGTGGKELQVLNMLSPYRINEFLSDGVSSVYKLTGENLSEERPIVAQLQPDGSRTLINDFTYDHIKGEVVFTTPPAEFTVKGTDSIFIQYRKDGEIDNYVNGCTFATTYGYGGNANRIFISGNNEFGRYFWYSEVMDATYFPTRNFAEVGTAPITGLSRLIDGQMAVHKKLTDTDKTVYYVSYNSLNNLEVFPIRDGAKVIGCLNDKCCQNFINDAVFLSELGVYSLNQASSDLTTNYAKERGYYIKKKLLEETNLENAVAIVHGTKYYLAINNKVYIADKRFLSATDNSLSDYQYEWFYWEDVPVYTWFTWENQLFFGTENGEIRCFTYGYEDDVVVDGEINKIPVKCYWESSLLDFGNPVRAKTVRRVFVHLNPFGNLDISLGYNLIDGYNSITDVQYTGVADNFTRVIQEKEKIAKLMYLQMVVQNETQHKCSFNNIILEYVISGKYRGD